MAFWCLYLLINLHITHSQRGPHGYLKQVNLCKGSQMQGRHYPLNVGQLYRKVSYSNIAVTTDTSNSARIIKWMVPCVADLVKVPLGDRDVFMEVFHTALLREVSHSVTFPSKDPFGCQEPIQTDWASGVNPCGAYTNLSPYNKKYLKIKSFALLLGHCIVSN